MRFKLWLESGTINIPITKLYGWKPKTDEVYEDIRAQRLSRSTGPVIVSRLDTPRGAFFILDGYHRIVEAALAGATTVEATIDVHIPRIERTGGAHADMVAQKVPIVELVQRLAALQQTPQ